jgi:thymidylate synthase
MAKRVNEMPRASRVKQVRQEDLDRLERRRKAVDVLREQADIATKRLRWDIFNVWRTGGGSMEAIAQATGFTTGWIATIIENIRNNPDEMREVVSEWMKENPGKPLNGELDKNYGVEEDES